MKALVKVLIVVIVLVFGITTFLVGPKIWPPHPDVHPTPQQLPFFMLLSAIEALTFGIGIAFIVLGWGIVRKASPAKKNWAIAMYFSIAWMLVSWWPHDNAHIHNGLETQGLLFIDYTFHFTLIIAAFILAYGLFVMLKEKK